jgi:hypothetical protein
VSTAKGSSKRNTIPKQTVNSQPEVPPRHPGDQIEREVDQSNEEDVVSLTLQTTRDHKPEDCNVPKEKCDEGCEVGAIVPGQPAEIERYQQHFGEFVRLDLTVCNKVKRDDHAARVQHVVYRDGNEQ